ncbi:MAG: hypothetical protein ACI4M6_01700 [Christensenellaceae bacterium]
MGRKIQIEKQTLLYGGLNVVIKSGHNALTANNLAKEVKCSTQPIFWWFKNMEGFKKELFRFALGYLNGKMSVSKDNAMVSYMSVGMVYVDAAFEEPNLLKFLLSDDKSLKLNGGIGRVFNGETAREMQAAISEQLGIAVDKVADMMTKLVIFADGLVSAILSGVVEMTKAAAEKHLYEMGNCLMIAFGVSEETIRETVKNVKA